MLPKGLRGGSVRAESGRGKAQSNMCSNCRQSNHTRCYGMVRLPHGGGLKPCECEKCKELKPVIKDNSFV